MTAPPRRLRRARSWLAWLGLTGVALGLVGPGRAVPSLGDARAALATAAAAARRAAADRQVDLLMALHRHLPLRGWDLRALAATERGRAGGLLGGAGGPVEVQPLEASALRDLGHGEATWLFTWVGTRHAYAWWLDGDGLRAREVGDPAATARLARRIQANLARGVPDLLGPQIEVDAASLSRLWLREAPPRASDGLLAVVADGPLAAVPWALLPWPGKPGVRVVDEVDTVLVGSAGELRALRRRALRQGGPRQGGAWRSSGTRCTTERMRGSPCRPGPRSAGLV